MSKGLAELEVFLVQGPGFCRQCLLELTSQLSAHCSRSTEPDMQRFVGMVMLQHLFGRPATAIGINFQIHVRVLFGSLAQGLSQWVSTMLTGILQIGVGSVTVLMFLA